MACKGAAAHHGAAPKGGHTATRCLIPTTQEFGVTFSPATKDCGVFFGVPHILAMVGGMFEASHIL